MARGNRRVRRARRNKLKRRRRHEPGKQAKWLAQRAKWEAAQKSAAWPKKKSVSRPRVAAKKAVGY